MAASRLAQRFRFPSARPQRSRSSPDRPADARPGRGAGAPPWWSPSAGRRCRCPLDIAKARRYDRYRAPRLGSGAGRRASGPQAVRAAAGRGRRDPRVRAAHPINAGRRSTVRRGRVRKRRRSMIRNIIILSAAALAACVGKTPPPVIAYEVIATDRRAYQCGLGKHRRHGDGGDLLDISAGPASGASAAKRAGGDCKADRRRRGAD